MFGPIFSVTLLVILLTLGFLFCCGKIPTIWGRSRENLSRSMGVVCFSALIVSVSLLASEEYLSSSLVSLSTMLLLTSTMVLVSLYDNFIDKSCEKRYETLVVPVFCSLYIATLVFGNILDLREHNWIEAAEESSVEEILSTLPDDAEISSVREVAGKTVIFIKGTGESVRFVLDEEGERLMSDRYKVKKILRP